MKRKLTIALLIVVLVLSLVTAVACGHKHDYTEWDYDDTEHWKYCAEDNEIDESSKAPHDFTNGDCVCGKEAPAPHEHSYTQWYKDDPVNHWKVCPVDNVKDNTSVAPHDYGTTGVCVCGRPEPDVEYTVEGVVVLHKLGTTTNSNDGVTFTLSDDDGDLPTEITKGADGKFSFKSNVGKYYLTATKDGYLEGSTTINVSKDVGDLTGEAALELTMEYDAFYVPGNYGDPSQIDKSHVNEAAPYFIIKDGTDLCQYSRDLYDDVDVSALFKEGLASYNPTIAFSFEGHESIMGRIERLRNDGVPTGEFKIQWIGDKNWEESNITSKWDFGQGEEYYNPISAELKEQYKSDGITLRMVRRGAIVSLYVDETLADTQVLPAKYADKKCQVAFMVGQVNSNQEIHYNISTDVAKTPVTITNPDVENGAVTVAGANIGDHFVLTVTPDESCRPTSLLINNEERIADIRDGKLDLDVYTDETLTIAATFAQYTLVDVNVEISGNYLGKTMDLNGQTVALTDVMGEKQNVEIANGKLTKQLADGTYTVTLDGYLPCELVVPKEGAVEAIVLDYNSLENMPFDWFITSPDLAEMNNGKFTTGTNGNSVAVKSVDKFGNVQVTLNAHKGNGGKQGVWFLFPTASGYDAVSITIKDSGAIEFDKSDWWSGSSHIKNVTVSAKLVPGKDGWWLADDDNNGIYQSLSAEEMTMYENGALKLSVIRYNNYFYVYVNGVYTGNWCVVDEAYIQAECYVGFVGTNTIANKEWSYEVKEVESLPALNITLPDAVEHVSVTLAADSYKLGDQVTLNITLDKNYVVESLKVDGTEIKHRIKDDKVSFTPTSTEEVVVQITVARVVYVDLDVAISGHKYGSSVALNGETVTLTDSFGKVSMPLTVTADGKLSKTDFPAGTYTVTLNGYLPATLTVNEDGSAKAVVMEFDAFYKGGPKWGDYDFSEQNNGKITMTNEYAWVYSNEKFDSVAFSMYLHPDGYNYLAKEKLGIALLFYNDQSVEHVSVRAEDRAKIQFSKDLGLNGFYTVNNAEGNDWNDLVSFDKNYVVREAFYNGTLKMTVVREGTTIYVFLNDVYFGKNVIADKYANVQCQVGVYFEGVEDKTQKTVTYAFEDVDTYRQINVTTTADNGTITVNGENNKVGDNLSVLIAANEGYKLTSVTANGKDITDQLVKGDDGFTWNTIPKTQSLNIKATYVAIANASIDVTVVCKKFGSDAEVAVTATTATLKDLYNTYTLDIVDGKITSTGNIEVGVYTLSVDGCVSKTVVVDATSGLTGTITFEVNIFTDAPASADLSQISDGIVTATGNGSLELTTIEKYRNVTAEAKFDVLEDYNNRRYGIALVFGEGDSAKNFRVDFCVQDGGANNILQQTNWNSMMFNWEWVNFPDGYFAQNKNHYTREEIENVFMKDGLTYKLEREGATVKLYINDVLMNTYTLTGEYANQEAHLKFIFDSYDTDGTAGFTFDITVPAVESPEPTPEA